MARKKFKCPACGEILERDGRTKQNKKHWILSYCEKKGKSKRCYFIATALKQEGER